MDLPKRPDQRFRYGAVAVLCAAAAFVLVTLGWLGKSGVVELLKVLGSFQLAGKFVIFGGLSQLTPFGPWSLGLASWLFDLTVAVALLSYLNRFERLPVVGRYLVAARGKADDLLLRYPGLKRLAFWGVALFVFLPVPGSGAVTGTFASLLLALPRTTALASIGLGSGLCSFAYAALAVLVGEQAERFMREPQFYLLLLVVFVLLCWWLYRRCLRILQRG